MKITSRDNQKLKLLRKVRDGKADDAVFVEGLRLCEEALRSNLSIDEVFFAENLVESKRGNDLIKNLAAKDTKVFEVSVQIFDSLSDTKNSQGVILIGRKPQTGRELMESNFETDKKQFPLVLLLHEINNPSNLGAVLRTSEAAGVCGVILTKNAADAFSPKALRASMGAGFRLPIWENADFAEALDWAEKNNLTSVCADVNSEKSYAEIDWKKPRLLVFGSEAHGLSFNERREISEDLIIPMANNVESLNLAVSCGIILFEAKRQIEEHLHHK